MKVRLWAGTKENNFILMDDFCVSWYSTSYLQGTLFCSIYAFTTCVIIGE